MQAILAMRHQTGNWYSTVDPTNENELSGITILDNRPQLQSTTTDASAQNLSMRILEVMSLGYSKRRSTALRQFTSQWHYGITTTKLDENE